MKKLFILLLAVAITVYGASQPLNDSGGPDKTDYMKKSRNHKTAAWILLSSGTVLVISGGLANAHEVYDPNSFDRSYSDKGTPFVIAGVVAMAGSIPLFIASAHNKHRAASLVFKTESVPQIHKTSIVYQAIPSLILKFPL